MRLFQRGILSNNLLSNTEQIGDFCFLPNLLPLKCKIMAGDDIAMNQFQIVSDAPYVYVELADGSQGKIKKSDLLNAMFQKGTPVKDYNLNTEIGIYYINVSVNGTINGPSNSISYGILFVLKGLNNYIVQIACSVTDLLNVFIRTRTELAWSDWKSITLT